MSSFNSPMKTVRMISNELDFSVRALCVLCPFVHTEPMTHLPARVTYETSGNLCYPYLKKNILLSQRRVWIWNPKSNKAANNILWLCVSTIPCCEFNPDFMTCIGLIIRLQYISFLQLAHGFWSTYIQHIFYMIDLTSSSCFFTIICLWN